MRAAVHVCNGRKTGNRLAMTLAPRHFTMQAHKRVKIESIMAKCCIGNLVPTTSEMRQLTTDMQQLTTDNSTARSKPVV